MIQPVRVVHYVNQFFGGIGGEEMAHVGVSLASGVVGASRALQQALGLQATLLGTLIGGDNYVSEQRAEAVAAITGHLQSLRPDVVIAGPAFNAGRYGLACAEVCKAAQTLGLAAVTGMHPENPGTLSYPAEVLIVPTGATSVEMPTALAAMVRLAMKLSRGEALGPAQVEGYLPRGLRRIYYRQRPGYLRALDMLQAKLRSEPFVTEVPIHVPERVMPATPIADLSRAKIAMVTTGGLVRKGNPDKQVSSNATRSEEHTSELQSRSDLVCRLLLEKKQ